MHVRKKTSWFCCLKLIPNYLSILVSPRCHQWWSMLMLVPSLWKRVRCKTIGVIVVFLLNIIWYIHCLQFQVISGHLERFSLSLLFLLSSLKSTGCRNPGVEKVPPYLCQKKNGYFCSDASGRRYFSISRARGCYCTAGFLAIFFLKFSWEMLPTSYYLFNLKYLEITFALCAWYYKPSSHGWGPDP